jgi:hypothetical protein
MNESLIVKVDGEAVKTINKPWAGTPLCGSYSFKDILLAN